MSTPPRRAGVTFAELLVVLVLLGLLGAAAVTRVGGITGPAKLEGTIGRLTMTDGTMRSHVAQHGRTGQLRFEMGSSRVRRSFAGESERTATTIDVGGGVTLRRFRSATRDVSRGTVTVDFIPPGSTETFAVELAAADGRSVWLLFAGLTGQVTRLEDQRDVETVLRAIQPERLHAD